jgi:hypothetical protein
MKYLLAIYVDESKWPDVTPEEAAATTREYMELSREMEAAGVLVAGDGLQSVSTATTVRVRDGERLLTDGPFAETREALGGYFLVDVDDLDAAVAWAERIPAVTTGSVEVRPLRVYDAEGRDIARDQAAHA